MADVFFNCPECNGRLVVDHRCAGIQLPCPFCAKPAKIPDRRDLGSQNVNGQLPEVSNTGTSVAEAAATTASSPPTVPTQISTRSSVDPPRAPGGVASGSGWTDAGRVKTEEIRRLAAMMVTEGHAQVGEGGVTSFRCPLCGQVMTAKRAKAGDHVRCTSCSVEFQIPVPRQPMEAERSSKGTLPAARNRSLRTADDLRKGQPTAEQPVADLPGGSDIDPHFQDLARREVERLPSGNRPSPTTRNAVAPPSTALPSRRKPPPPLAEHGDVVPVGPSTPNSPASSSAGPAPRKRLDSSRSETPPAPFVSFESIEFDSEVARHWGETAVVPIRKLNWIAMAVILAAVAVGGFFAYQQFRPLTQPKEDHKTPTEILASRDPQSEAPLNPSEQGVMTTLQAFHDGLSAETKATSVRNAEAALPLMKAYYDLNDVESRFINPNKITIRREVIDNRWIIHRVRGEYEEAIEPFYADVEETPDGRFLLDWKSWVGYNQLPLESFAQEGHQQAHTFRVWVEVRHNYRYAYKNAAKFRSYHLKNRAGTVKLHGYALHGSPAGKQLLNLFRELKRQDRKRARLMLSLRFDPDVDKTRGQVLIDDLVSESWIQIEPPTGGR